MTDSLPPLDESEINKITSLVNRFLPPEYDREFITDTIVVNTWISGVRNVSRQYVKQKCMNAWRDAQIQRSHYEKALEIRPTQHESTEKSTNDKMFVDSLVSRLTPSERKLIWLRFWDEQTLEEMAENMGESRERVQQRLKEVLYKMQIT